MPARTIALRPQSQQRFRSVRYSVSISNSASGILETADFAAQSNALGDKINALRSQRRTLLKQNENDDLLAELHELKDTLDDMDGEITVYDEDLIRSVIQYATVLSDTELRIHIKGGLEVTEQLPQYYTRRCRRK